MRPLLPKTRGSQSVNAISNHIAQSYVGRMVSVQMGARTPAHGIVAGVLLDGGLPKLVVDGNCYDLRQVLTVTPRT